MDNCKSTCIVGLTEEFENLEVLSLINVGLTTLKGFPALPNLRKVRTKTLLLKSLNPTDFLFILVMSFDVLSFQNVSCHKNPLVKSLNSMDFLLI